MHKNTTLRRAAAALMLFALGACEAAPTAARTAAGRADEDGRVASPDWDVHETTLRYLFANHGAADRDAYCVSTGYPDATDDPSQVLLDRFTGTTPPVVPYSHCTISVSGDTYNPTGGPAQWFFLGAPQYTQNYSRATIQTGWHINGRLVEWYSCSLRATGTGVWSVSSCTLTAAG